MEDVNMQEQSSQEQVASQLSQTANGVLDAASIAAKSIADASGVQSLEQAASMISALESRVKSLESALPDILALANDLKDAIPQSFITRVEGFFTAHFPNHAAPKTE